MSRSASTTSTSSTSSPMTSGSTPQPQVPHEKIAKRAYEKWCKRGCPQGSEQQDWLEAEAELKSETGKTSSAPSRR